MAKNFVREHITEITRLATKDIPAIVSGNSVDCRVYNDARCDLNNHLIQALVGGEFVENKKGDEKYKVRFCHALPTRQELAEIIQIMDVFTKTVEIPFMEELEAMDVETDDDMDIPPRNSNLTHAFAGSGIDKIEKITAKNLKNFIFGYESKVALIELMLSPADCMQIAAMGEDLRKKTNRNKMLIIGGIALVVTGGIATGMFIRNKKEQDMINDNIHDRIDDIDEIGVDDVTGVEVETDDAPVVTID